MLKTVPKTENTRKRRFKRLFFYPFAGIKAALGFPGAVFVFRLGITSKEVFFS